MSNNNPPAFRLLPPASCLPPPAFRYMSYEPLHHKYRPQTFADLVGQEAIATTLTSAINSQRIVPAYLFTGPRGTGKTSSARILAKSLNCLNSDKPTPTPCGHCEVCRATARGSALDVIEIDAASNTGVDNIRELIERAQFAPVQCRYKVYVIDECHMLSTAAFNALLKTLEEPPERVIFILATTDPQRVLPTIISRCQRFDYRRIPIDSMVSHLDKIARQENINITPEAITLVAQLANGGLRDAESLLDQLSLLPDTIVPEKVWDLVGAVSERDLLALLKAIASDQPEAMIEECRRLLNRGREPLVILQNLAGFYLNLLIAKTAPKRPDLVAVTSQSWQQLCTEAQSWDLNKILQGQQHLKESEVQLKNTTQPRLWLEITLLGLLPSANSSQPSVVQPQVRQENPLPIAKPSVTPPPQNQLHPSQSESEQPSTVVETRLIASSQQSGVLQETSIPEETIDSPVAEIASFSLEEIWQEVLKHLRPLTTQALLSQQCNLISFDGSVARVTINSETLLKLHKDKVPNIEAAFAKVCQKKVQVKLQAATTSKSSNTSPLQSAEKQISAISLNPVQEEKQLSISSPEVPPTLINNGSRDIVLSQTKTEPQKNQSYLPISPTSEVSKDIAVANQKIPPSSSNTNSSANISESEEDIKKASESLAKCFEGELIFLTYQADNESLDTNSSVDLIPESLLDNNLNRETSNLENQPIIRGRPDVTDVADPDDIPF